MVPAAGASTRDASFHAVQRRLATLMPDSAAMDGGAALELSAATAQDRPRLDPPEALEDQRVRAHPVSGAREAHIAAFLDGTQTSRVLRYLGGVPIVHWSVAGVIRVRRDRRMATWEQPIVRRALYTPLSLLPPAARDALGASNVDVVDTSANREIESLHPFM